MAKGQNRGNREPKKPKQEKPKDDVKTAWKGSISLGEHKKSKG